ncbi:hypothetical protein [Rhizobium leguminosarum]|jgi:hypothetical protein|uniref:hypothetical protein n=1 Tax=Rhizobium leguminosarum TaxID=384 RepID=UPI00102F3656|nr:hypothetical protein [Rhizobium leguminosarum]TBG15989.1 hypothetical protein ELG80_08995 [Rhizobium leguminosarum]
MKPNYAASARFLRRRFVRHAWTTTQQKWTTSFVVVGLLVASAVMPTFGIAVFGTAFAGWWLAVSLLTVFFGLLGNRAGIGLEKAALQRKEAE